MRWEQESFSLAIEKAASGNEVRVRLPSPEAAERYRFRLYKVRRKLDRGWDLVFSVHESDVILAPKESVVHTTITMNSKFY